MVKPAEVSVTVRFPDGEVDEIAIAANMCKTSLKRVLEMVMVWFDIPKHKEILMTVNGTEVVGFAEAEKTLFVWHDSDNPNIFKVEVVFVGVDA